MDQENQRQDSQIRNIHSELGSLKDQIEKFQKTMEILRHRPGGGSPHSGGRVVRKEQKAVVEV